ncbi:MAG TPA: hypothetical protein VK213_01600 [Bacteroidales bacterium]|nr:hypothetical protein [Bacteroidales bacterium]
MKKSAYKHGIFLLPVILLSLSLSAQEVTKEYHEEYNAGAATTLQINNRYGDVIIDSWDNDQVVVDVKVTLELPDRERAEKLLQYISVEFTQNGDVISAKTVIDDKFNFSGWGGGNKRFSIDYSVRMPVKSSLSLTNKYGNANVDELKGLAEFDIKYGNITIGKLTRGNEKPLNRLSIAYGKGSIDEAGWIDLMVRYSSGLDITSGQAFLLDSKYSKVNIGEVSSVVGESKYDNLTIDNINNLVLENGYTEVKIGTLNKKLDYNGSYGSFTVNSVPSGFESIDLNTRYMGVNLGIEENADYNLEARVSYGGLKYNEENFINKRRIIENNTREIQGVVGKNENPEAYVNVTASYGSVRLF